MKCTEKFLEDIVRIDFYLASEVELGIPAVVPNVQTEQVDLSDAMALFSLTVNEDGTGVMDDHPTLKIKEARAAQGTVRTCTLDATLSLGDVDAVKTAIDGVMQKDVIAFYTTAEGKQYFIPTLYNTSTLTYEEDYGTSHSLKVSHDCKAMSGLVEASIP